jgi:hypothetical protein
MWRPTQRVLGAWAGRAHVGRTGQVSVRVAVGEGARALACVLGAPDGSAGGLARRMQQASATRRGCRSLVLTSPRGLEVRLASPASARQRYVGVRFTADANVARSTTLVRPVR